eukprot:TRINITY_DN1509_c0_g1_i1.p1 TRINITY_DN1509_c0_g1~~TRINITY_DN1509_c0_g1_i1.p1  ORF type:complete len:405 (+),score=70.16 TRINITY_DN1509_c0_g1_i1:980-2194(+)
MSGDSNNNNNNKQNVQVVSGYLVADGVRNEVGSQKLLQIIKLHDSSVVEIVQAGGEVDIAQNEQSSSEGGKERWGLPEGGRICGQAFVVKRSQPPLFQLVVLNRINASSQKFFSLPLTVTEVKKAGPEDMGKPGVASVLMFRLLDYNQWWGVVFKNQQHLQEMHQVIKRITANFTIQSTKDAQLRPWNIKNTKQVSEDVFFDVPKDFKKQNSKNRENSNNFSITKPSIEAGELEKNMVNNNTQVPLDQLKFLLQEKSSTQKEGQQLQGDPPRSIDDLLSDLVVKTTPRQQQQIQTTNSPTSNRTNESESLRNEISQSPNTKEKDFVELLNGWSLQNNNNNNSNSSSSTQHNNNNSSINNNNSSRQQQVENSSRKEERQRLKAAFSRLLEKDQFLDLLLDELKNA